MFQEERGFLWPGCRDHTFGKRVMIKVSELHWCGGLGPENEENRTSDCQ